MTLFPSPSFFMAKWHLYEQELSTNFYRRIMELFISVPLCCFYLMTVKTLFAEFESCTTFLINPAHSASVDRVATIFRLYDMFCDLVCNPEFKLYLCDKQNHRCWISWSPINSSNVLIYLPAINCKQIGDRDPKMSHKLRIKRSQLISMLHSSVTISRTAAPTRSRSASCTWQSN